jgi:DNA-binding MarR family transcriptional regulator
MSNSNEDRTANLLAAAALGLDDAVSEALHDATGLDRTASTALIALLDFTPAGSLARLAAVLGLTHSGTVRLVDRLVELAYVERTPGPDSRSRSVVLSRSGRALARRARTARARVMREAVSDLKPQQRQALSELCSTIVGGIAQRRLAQRVAGTPPPSGAVCRQCDFAACGRDRGRCPAAITPPPTT